MAVDPLAGCARLAGVLFGRAGMRIRAVESLHSICAAIIREICSRSVEQGRCELVVCAASEKSLLIGAYRALELSHCHRSHACVFVWACLRIDFAKGLELSQREEAPKALGVD
jgi:hypothetical protein